MTQPLQVPARFEEPLRVLSQLSEDDFAALMEFLDNQDLLLPPQELGEGLGERLPDIADHAGGLLSAAVSLIMRVQHHPEEAADSAERVAMSEELGIEDEQRPLFIDRLSAILLCPAVRLAAKALDLLTDYDHVYYGARILTDIRPVFSDNRNTLEPVGAIVMANLKIEHYGPAGDLTSFHVALDHADLLELQEVVKKGLEKTTSVKTFLEEKSMSYLQDAEDHDA